MLLEEKNSVVILKGEAALNLFLEGKDAWNLYIKKWSVGEIDFSFFDFSNLVLPNTGISFNGFDLSCKVNFCRAIFGDADVSFGGVDFGSGHVNFQFAKFGKGRVQFGGADFRNCFVTFTGVDFGDGRIDFQNTKFSQKDIDFSYTNFGKGDVYFTNTEFDNAVVSFVGARFGEGRILFKFENFENGKLNFTNLKAEKRNLDFQDIIVGEVCFDGADCQNVNFQGVTFVNEQSFRRATFYNSNFQKAIFLKGANFHETIFNNINFQEAQLNYFEYNFEKSEFKGHADFSGLKKSFHIKSLSFRKASFEKSLDLSNNEFNVVPDLISTKTVNHVSLHDLKLNFKRPEVGLPNTTSITNRSYNVALIRRLREIAEINKDHDTALIFHAEEMREKRGQQGFMRSILDIGFSVTSNYGQSALRPFLGWLISSLILLITCMPFTFTKLPLSEILWLSIKLCIANTMPFLASSKLAIDQINKTLFGEITPKGQVIVDPPELFNVMLMLHGVTSFIFMFLIGLALRNRFRI